MKQKVTFLRRTGTASFKTRDPTTHLLVSATDMITSNWNRIWDEALEYGVRGTRFMQGLFGALARPTFGDKACPHCNETISSSYPEHLFTKHLTNYNVATVVTWLEHKDFNNLFKLADAITSTKF